MEKISKSIGEALVIPRLPIPPILSLKPIPLSSSKALMHLKELLRNTAMNVLTMLWKTS